MKYKLSFIKDSIDSLIKQKGWEDDFEESELRKLWNNLNDGRFTEITEYFRFHNGVLTVKINSAPWRTELLLRKENIKSELNTQCKKNIIKEIKIR